MDIIKQFTVFVLVLLLAIYSGGISITKHLCNDKVVSKAINWKVKKCKLAQNSQDYPLHQNLKKACCSAEFTSIKTAAFAKFSAPQILSTLPTVVYKMPVYQVFKTISYRAFLHPPRANLKPIYLLVACFRI